VMILMLCKNRFRVLHDSAQEQLADAYVRAVSAQSMDNGERLLILQSVSSTNPHVSIALHARMLMVFYLLVPRTQHTITLRDIINSLNPDSATQRITSLRKMLLSKFIEPAIPSRGKVSVNGSAVLLELGQSSSDPIEDLNSLMEFLKGHLFVSLPSQYHSQLVGELIPRIQSCLLDHLKRTIPSLVTKLPQYISLVERAVAFEATILQTNVTGSVSLARPINDWAANLPNHYEKKRRELILQDVRNILSDETRMGGLRVEKPKPSVGSKNAEAVRRDSQSDVVGATPDHTQPTPADGATTVDEENGWGFDDLGGEEEAQIKEAVGPTVDSSSGAATSTEEADPWDDDPWDDPVDNEPAVTPSQSQTVVPKSAKGLEKFSSKSKGSSIVSAPPTNGSVHSMNGSGPLSPTLSNLSSPIVSSPVTTSESYELHVPKIKETFLVSECAQAIVQTLRAVVQEGQELAQSR
jgi:centromere/kinetochore protein ZW10